MPGRVSGKSVAIQTGPSFRHDKELADQKRCPPIGQPSTASRLTRGVIEHVHGPMVRPPTFLTFTQLGQPAVRYFFFFLAGPASFAASFMSFSMAVYLAGSPFSMSSGK